MSLACSSVASSIAARRRRSRRRRRRCAASTPQRGVVALVQQRLGQAPQAGEAPVEGADRAAEIGDEDAVGGRFERRPQFADERVAFVLDPALRREVVQRDQVQAGRPAGLHVRDAARHRQQAAVGAAQQAVGKQRLAAAAGGLAPELLVLGRRDERLHRAAGQRIERQLQQRRRRGIAAQQAQAFGIDQPDGVEQGLDQRRPAAQVAGLPPRVGEQHGGRIHAAASAPSTNFTASSRRPVLRRCAGPRFRAHAAASSASTASTALAGSKK